MRGNWKHVLPQTVLCLLALTGAGTLQAGPGLAAEDEVPGMGEPAGEDAGASALGEELYLQHCTECHSSVAHVRQNRKVQAPEDLRRYIREWSDYLDLGWDDNQRNAVEHHLDLHYYDFGRGQS